MNRIPVIIALFLFPALAQAQPKTFCNPLNLDYGFFPIPNFVKQGKHRATADPVIVLFKGNEAGIGKRSATVEAK